MGFNSVFKGLNVDSVLQPCRWRQHVSTKRWYPPTRLKKHRRTQP